ncbi:hypothetical protein [Streptomyces stelliscabiei]|uniref:hypothetical protein n=1 Tax=Streptomyces stelliscabiei TaxID=146820 RepID=UPI002FEFE6E3
MAARVGRLPVGVHRGPGGNEQQGPAARFRPFGGGREGAGGSRFADVQVVDGPYAEVLCGDEDLVRDVIDDAAVLVAARVRGQDAPQTRLRVVLAQIEVVVLNVGCARGMF